MTGMSCSVHTTYGSHTLFFILTVYSDANFTFAEWTADNMGRNLRSSFRHRPRGTRPTDKDDKATGMGIMRHLDFAITQVACRPLHLCACRTCSSIKAPGQSGSLAGLGTWEAGEVVVIPSVELPIGARSRRMRSLPGVQEVLLFARMANQIMHFCFAFW